MADETGTGLGDCGGAVVVVETIPQRLQGVCWTGDNLEVVEALAGDAWLGVTLRGNPLVATTGGTRPELERGWWLLVDGASGVIVSAGDAAERTYRLAGATVANETPAYRTGRHDRGIIRAQLDGEPGSFDPKVAVLFPGYEHLASTILDALNEPDPDSFGAPVPGVLRTAIDLLRAHGCRCNWQAFPARRSQPASWTPRANPACVHHAPALDLP